MPGFQRVNPIAEGLIRGPARLIIAPIGVAFPSQLSQMINIATTSTGYNPAVQSLTMAGTPTGGTFTLAFEANYTAPIAYNATAAAIQAALNAIGTIADAGGVTCTGGPVSTTAVVITFGANGSQPLLLPTLSGNALVGATAPTAVVSSTQLGNGQFDVAPGSGWSELGSTRSGVQIAKNNTEDQLDIDQIYGSILGVPNEHEMTVATQLAEVTLENIALTWDQPDPITVNVTTPIPERTLSLGAPLAYTQRRLAVLHQKTIGPAAGLTRAVVFRSTTRSAANSMLDYQKQGQMQTLPHQFRAYVDPFMTDQNARFGAVIEQQLD
jgi:hypothetical protein